MSQFFNHLKVIELASVLAGPSVGMFFAELGARVIKVENKRQRGDVTRSWKLASEDTSHPFSAYYSSVNYGKESLFLDLTEDQDYEKVITEIQSADIVICNFKAGDAEKLKLDFKALRKIKPDIIYGEISGFGDSKRIAYDVVLQAESGFLSMNGSPEGKLCKMPVALIDLLAAHQLKEGLLIAMLQQKRVNRAYRVSVSLFDSAVAGLANQATNWIMGKHIAQPMGTIHPNIAPYGELFSCKDGKQLVLAIGSERQFQSLCECLSLSQLTKDDRFKNNQQRVQHRKALEKELKLKIETFNRDELMSRFLEANVPAGAVRNMAEVFALPEAQKRILSETKEGKILKTISGNSFKIETS